MPASRQRKRKELTARGADRRRLYQHAVQCVESEIDFVDRWYRRLRGHDASRLREDFCGSFASACEWVGRRSTNSAVGVDLDPDAIAWGIEHNLGALAEEARPRVDLHVRDVRNPLPDATGVDIVLAMNFSYNAIMTRHDLVEYFRSVRDSLAPGGIFFLDYYGGWETTKLQKERRRVRSPEGRFTYVWEQASYNSITGEMRCYIHFEFPDGTSMPRAFRYDWRIRSLPELREMLDDAGFGRVTVYWEGDDGKGGGNGVFRPAVRGETCPSYIGYISAER